MSQRLRRMARTTFDRAPWVRARFFSTIDRLVRPLLRAFAARHPRPAPAARATSEQVDTFNRAAEDYFARLSDPQPLLRKPFSEPAALSRRLIDLGVLIDGLRLRPGDTVLELGAGACWVSHFLNRMGCRTIAVDVSSSALALGRRLFESDPATDWSLDPQFQVYDGTTLPTPDASVDAIVLYDVFHHLPNPETVLGEMRRVLRANGIVAMSEPGRGHADSAPSRAESSETGVLESELVIEDIAAMAVAAGFAAARVIVAPNAPLLEVDAVRMRAFMAGQDFSRYWSGLCAALDSHYYVLLFTGDPAPTTSRPKHLKASLRHEGGGNPRAAHPGASCPVVVRLVNAGDTRWLSTSEAAGWTRLGAHLYRDTSPWTLVDYDWARYALPHDVGPGESVTLNLRLPPITTPGRYIVVFDLVVEGMVWFADGESAALYLPLDVR